MVLESSAVKDDLVQDRIEVLTWFGARLYGRRSARNKAKKAVPAMEQPETVPSPKHRPSRVDQERV